MYFVRHGESEANTLHVISNRGWKHGLTEKGREQAQALAERLRGKGITRIYTSPLMRAVQTGEIVARALDVPLERTHALGEIDCGIAEGRSDAEAWALHARVSLDWTEGRSAARIPDGESLEGVRARFAPFVESLLERGEDVLLVGHGGLYHGTLPDLLNVDLAYALQRGFPNTGCVLAEQRHEGLVCLEWLGERPVFKTPSMDQAKEAQYPQDGNGDH